MYSPYYYYFEIRGNDDYSAYTDTEPLVKYLTNELQLDRTSEDSFDNGKNDPWIKLSLVCADSHGSYSTKRILPKSINLVTIVGSEESGNRDKYVAILTTIAEKLNWDLIEERGDDGDDVVWKLDWK